MSILKDINLGFKFKRGPAARLAPPVSPGGRQNVVTRQTPGSTSSAASLSAAAQGLGLIPPVVTLGYSGPIYTAVDWIEKYFYDPTTVTMFGRDWDYSHAKTLELDPVQKRILNHVLTPDEDGFYPYSTVVYSTIKKEGKTTMTGAVGSYWGCQVTPADLILCLANDQEQSAGRIFGAQLPTLQKLGARVPMSISSKPEIRIPNGTIIQAIANNYAGNAGANYSLTLWSELWAYTSERSQRLYDELIPVPTKKNSIRWIETYVGFEDESDLMLKLFLRIFTDTSETGIQPNAKPVPELIDITTDGRPSCWHIPEEGLFYYHNHTPRMYWNIGQKGDKYRASQRADLRPSQYIRLHENRWQAAEGTLIQPEEYDDAITVPGPNPWSPMYLAGDASQRNDSVVLVGTTKYTINVLGEEQERYKLVYCSVWDPKIHGAKQSTVLGTQKGDLDLENTIANEIYRLYKAGLIIGPFRYDPYQMHQVAVNLRKKGVPCVEFSQQTDRLKSDTFFANLMRKGLLDLYHHPVLERHIKNAKAKEYENEQIRIVKGTVKKTNKVDGAVALAMSCYVASQYRPVKPNKRTTSSRILR